MKFNSLQSLASVEALRDAKVPLKHKHEVGTYSVTNAQELKELLSVTSGDVYLKVFFGEFMTEVKVTKKTLMMDLHFSVKLKQDTFGDAIRVLVTIDSVHILN